MSGIGHNRGPELDGESGWKTFAWGKARKALVPVLPIEVVRMHVRRAQALGLPYRSYAGIRAQTGRDVIGFLFSSNALRMLKSTDAAPATVVERLSLLPVDRAALARAPIDAAQLRAALPLDAAAAAPRFTESWALVRARVATLVGDRGLPADGIVMIGETSEERDWSNAAKLAGFISGGDWLAGPMPTA